MKDDPKSQAEGETNALLWFFNRYVVPPQTMQRFEELVGRSSVEE